MRFSLGWAVVIMLLAMVSVRYTPFYSEWTQTGISVIAVGLLFIWAIRRLRRRRAR